MPAEPSSNLKFEIGHVLFIDIVGYSNLLITEQTDHVQKLNKIILGTEQFRIGQAEGKMFRLPTGDGAALVFLTTQEAPVLCAIEIANALRDHPELPVRMGIHSGPVNQVSDVTERANIAGAGINIAQRVMNCGDAGHILLSRHVAEDLEHYPHWRVYLHELGDCEVKNGGHVSVFNFYSDEIGNPALPKKFAQKKQDEKSSSRRLRTRIAGLILLAALAAAGSWFFSHRLSSKPEAVTGRTAKIHCRPSVRKFERRKSKPVFRRRHAGRNPDRSGQDRRPEGDQPHQRHAIQDRCCAQLA